MRVFVHAYSAVNRLKPNLAKTQGVYDGVQYEKSKNKKQRGYKEKRQRDILQYIWTFVNTWE